MSQPLSVSPWNEQLSVRESEPFRVHLELLLPTAERCWRACDGVETTRIPSLLENTQIVVSNELYICRYCTPVSSPQCMALGGPRAIDVVVNMQKKTWTDAIIKMFPPMMTTLSARILASRLIKLATISANNK
jgi:hypothetical protein